jgi:hypothetical protein
MVMENVPRKILNNPLVRIVGLCLVLGLPECIGAWPGSRVYFETTLEARPDTLLVLITAMTLCLDDLWQDGRSRR